MEKQINTSRCAVFVVLLLTISICFFLAGCTIIQNVSDATNQSITIKSPSATDGKQMREENNSLTIPSTSKSTRPKTDTAPTETVHFHSYYHIIKSQKSKRKVRLWTIIVIGVVVLGIVFLGIYDKFDVSTNTRTNNAGSAEPPVMQIVSASTFDNQTVLLDAACQKALAITKETEKECIDNYGWSITTPTQIQGVFFLDARDPENPHRNYFNKQDVSNAIVVVAGYFLEDAGITIKQWEMDVWVYPNYSFNESGELSYDVEMEYRHSLRSENMENFMKWFNSEYSDMIITELNYFSSLM